MPLKEGEKAPDFTLTDQNENTQSLEELLKDGPLVLFFYPKDSSAGCTQQACSFRDQYTSLRAYGVSIAGINPADEASHATFAEENNLPYPLLSDTDKSVHNSYGVNTVFGLVSRRVTFLIDTDKTILLRYENNFMMKAHVQAVRKFLEKN